MARALSSLARLREISAVIARHGLDHYREGRPKGARRSKRLLDPQEAEARAKRLAKRFRNVLEELGTTFIKFGQVLSTRGDLVSKELAHELASLQDRCVPLPFDVIEKALAEGLNKPVSALFSHIDKAPLASASVAQVHAAKLLDGTDVVIKVQRPGVADRVADDLELLRYLAQLCEAIIEESGVVMPRAIVDTFEDALLGELDFTNEAQNLARFRDNLVGKERTYVVPEVYAHASSRTVLTMSRLFGRRVSELTDADDGPSIAGKVVRACFDQVFVDGLFHGDPHPGNCLLQDDGKLALLDFGLTGTISYAMRETLVMLVIAVGMRDAEAVARLLYRVGIPTERVSLQELRDACASLLDERLRDRKTFATSNAAGLLQDIFGLASRFGVRLPSEYALIGRAAMTVEGVLRQLDPEFTVVEQAKPLLQRLVEQQFALEGLGQGALKTLLRARDLSRHLPLSFLQIVMDLEAGKLRLQIDNAQLGAIARNIDALGIVISLGAVAAALIGGALFLLIPYTIELKGVPIVPLLALNLAGLLVGIILGRALVGPRLRKLSLGKWLARRRRQARRK